VSRLNSRRICLRQRLFWCHGRSLCVSGLQYTKWKRGGFTLIEVLVVISIIALLLGITIPAVQRIRESARRVQCLNHLKQVGIGLASHQSVQGHFPSAMLTSKGSDGRHMGFDDRYPVLYQLLPHIDQPNLYNSINFKPYSQKQSIVSNPNQTAYNTRVNLFVCPSDSKTASSLAPVSYRLNAGVPRFNVSNGGPLPIDPAQPGDYLATDAAFELMTFLSARDFPDGLSQTAGFSERLVGSLSTTQFDPSRDFWYANAIGLIKVTTADQLVSACSSSNSTPSHFFTRLGHSWAGNNFSSSWYNHCSPPNPRMPDCTMDFQPPNPEYGLINLVAVSAKSGHSAGVHTLMMDGSVKFVADQIAPTVWRSLGSRNGAELIRSAY